MSGIGRGDGARQVPPWWLALYGLLAVWQTWPIARHLTTHVALGSETAITPPLMSVWTVWWNADRLRHGLVDYWHAPIFHPESHTFAFSEAQPTMFLVAPLVWAFETPLAAYNVYLLLCLTLNGWFGARLIRGVHGRADVALIGGAMLQMLPFVQWRLGVVQTVSLWGGLWALAALWRFSETPRIRTGVSAGVAFALAYLTCNYHGMFLALVLFPAGLFLLGRRLQETDAWLRLLPGAAVAILLVLPVVAVQLGLSAEREGSDQWGPELLRALSAKAVDYARTPWPELVPLGNFGGANRLIALSPGTLKYALAAIGLVAGLYQRRLRRWTAFCLTFGGAAVVLSMGPNFKIGSWVLHGWLADVVPGFAAMRSVFRAGVFAQIGVALLAAGGLVVLARLAEFAVDRFPRGHSASDVARQTLRRTLAAVVVVAVGGAGALEVVMPAPRAFEVPRLERNEGWISWLRDNTEPTDAVVAVPFTVGGAVENYQRTILEMYWGMFHGRPLANGYSSYYPPRFMQLMNTMYHRFPEPPALYALKIRGVRYLIVRRRELAPRHAERLEQSTGVERVYADDQAGVDVYRLTIGAAAG
jgi:hypothetical protein